jgi:hypothetical protein
MVKVGARFGSGPLTSAPEAIDPSAGHVNPDPTAAPQIARRARTVRRYAGSGRGRSGPFLIGAPGTWGLSWDFHCADHDGQFIVTDHSRSAGSDIAVAPGLAGHGVAWASNDPGLHVLTVNTPCKWTIRVLVPSSR